MRFAELDAVTVDGHGTILRLVDPVPVLGRTLAARGVERDPGRVRAAFAAEARYYRAHQLEGRDERALARLHGACAGVFLAELEADLPAEEFAPEYVAALSYEVIAGAQEELARLRARGLELAVVANWEVSLHEHLRELGLDAFFTTVVTAAEAGALKPGAAVFELALERLAVRPERALHVGDEPADEEGAAGVGMHFAPAPLATAFEGWR